MNTKLSIILPAALVALVAGGFFQRSLGGGVEVAAGEPTDSLYDLKTRTLEGEEVALADYRGKVALVVNVASKCGLTPQYEGLEALYRELAPLGFVVLGFPSNDFKGQEPGTPAEIRQFCTVNYGVTFPLFEKVKVKGDDRCEVYRLLTANLAEPDWNFTKYLIDPEGHVVQRFGPRTKPDDEGLRRQIEELLARVDTTGESGKPADQTEVVGESGS